MPCPYAPGCNDPVYADGYARSAPFEAMTFWYQ